MVEEEEAQVMASLKQIRLFKHRSNNNNKKEAIFLFNVRDVIYRGKPGILTPTLFGLSFDSGLLDDETLDDLASELVSRSGLFGSHDVKYGLAREISGHIRSCYRFNMHATNGNDSGWCFVLVADVDRTLSSWDYLEAKVKGLVNDVQDDDNLAASRDYLDPKEKGLMNNGDYLDAKGLINDDGETLDDYDVVNDDNDDDDECYMDDYDDNDDWHMDDDDDDDDGGGGGGGHEVYEADGEDFDMEDAEHDREVLENDMDEDNLKGIVKYLRPLLVQDENKEEFELIEVKRILKIENMEDEIKEDERGELETVVVMKGDFEKEHPECSICLREFGGEREKSKTFPWLSKSQSWRIVRLYSCGHVFHHRCIFKWLPKTPSCPLCRSSTLIDCSL